MLHHSFSYVHLETVQKYVTAVCYIIVIIIIIINIIIMLQRKKSVHKKKSPVLLLGCSLLDYSLFPVCFAK